MHRPGRPFQHLPSPLRLSGIMGRDGLCRFCSVAMPFGMPLTGPGLFGGRSFLREPPRELPTGSPIEVESIRILPRTGQAFGLLGVAGWASRLYTPTPSTRSSSLRPQTVPLFAGGFGLRCFQPLSLRAWLPGLPCRTTGTPEAPGARSFRTEAPFHSGTAHLRQLTSELSHDVLNPAHDPL